MSSKESPEWAKRDAKLYLYLANEYRWTPEQVNAIDPAVRFAMATDLGLVTPDDGDRESNPAKTTPRSIARGDGVTILYDRDISLDDARKFIDAFMRQLRCSQRPTGCNPA